MSSNTYRVDAPTTGILSYALEVVCLQNISLHQKNVLMSAGRVLHNILQGFCTTEGYIIKQTTVKYNEHPSSPSH